jgi:Putative Ig domain
LSIVSSPSDNPTSFGSDTSRTITWTANDGALNSTAATSTVNITAVDDAPLVTAGATVTFTAHGSAAALDSGLTLSDPDNTTLASATVSIGGFLAGDTLNFVNQNGISGNYDSGTGVLTLTGASVANYETALESISFSTSGADITSGGSDRTRTLSWQVTDSGGAASDAATSTVTINDPPVLTPSGAHSTFNAGGAPVPLDGGLTLINREASQLIGATVSITGNFLTGDTLAASTAGTNITAVYDNVTGVLTLSGADTLAHYQTVLDGMTYSSSAADPTSAGARLSRAVSLTVTDVNGPLQVDSNTAIVTLTVHSPPVVTAGATATFNVGGVAVPLDGALTLTDAQSSTINGATVSISSGFFAGDTLNFTDQNGITGSYDGSTGVLTLSGTASVANYQAALASISYSSSAADPSNGGTDPSRTVSWSATDGIASSSAATSTLVTNGPPPMVDTNTASASFIQQGASVVLDSVVTANDVDGNTLVRATVSITGGFLAGDTLAANTAGTSITAVYNATTGILTLTGADTEVHYAQVLQNVTYSSSAVDPTAGGADRVRTLSWQVDDGKSGNNLSNIGTSTLATHVRPVVVAGETVTFSAGAPLLVDPGVVATNADTNPIITAKVQITDGLLSSDVLAFNNGTNSMSFGDGATISGTYNSATGTLTLSVAGGAPSAADFQQAMQSITFANAGATPGSAAAMSVRTLSWTLGTADPRQTSQAATSKIDPPPPPPAPPPPSGATGPVVAAPPAGPPPGLAPPPPTASIYSFVPPTGLGFSFAPPSFTSVSTPISDIFSTGPGGMPNFFAPVQLEFGGTFSVDGSVMVADGHPFEFQVPRNAFAVAADDRGVSFAAALVDGRALPSWLSFDPKSGAFGGDPPAGAKGVYDIAVTIRDAQGQQATKVFRFTVGQRQASLDGAPAAPGGIGASAAIFAMSERDSGASGRSPLSLVIDRDRLDEAAPMGAAVASGEADRPAARDAPPVGKTAFSAQLRAAGRQGLLNDRQALLNSLHNGLGG